MDPPLPHGFPFFIAEFPVFDISSLLARAPDAFFMYLK